MREFFRILGWVVLITLAVMGFLALCVYFFPNLEAREMSPPANLWQGLIAEATSEGYEGMYAVCCVVRNRLAQGLSTGLSGLNRSNLGHFCLKEGQLKERWAKEIVYKVFLLNSSDITSGATHFESIDFPKPRWTYKMKETCKIGKHIFYKEK